VTPDIVLNGQIFESFPQVAIVDNNFFSSISSKIGYNATNRFNPKLKFF